MVVINELEAILGTAPPWHDVRNARALSPIPRMESDPAASESPKPLQDHPTAIPTIHRSLHNLYPAPPGRNDLEHTAIAIWVLSDNSSAKTT